MKIGIISDIHEDIQSLKRALDILNKKKCDEIICLGDISGYASPYYKYLKSRDASQCVKLIKSECSLVIPGNHDFYGLRKLPVSNPGFEYSDDWYKLDFEKRKELGGDKIWLYEDTELESNLSEADKEFINSLPEYSIKEISGQKIMFSHHLYPDITGSSTRLLPDKGLQESHIAFMRKMKCTTSFFGHNHVEGLWILREKKSNIRAKIKTKGSNEPLAIGVPCIARGSNRPGYTLFDTESGMINSYPLYPLLWKKLIKNG